MKINLCLIGITSVLVLCYQSMYSSGDTTALHVAVAALKVLGFNTRVRVESGKDRDARSPGREVVHFRANLKGGRVSNSRMLFQLHSTFCRRGFCGEKCLVVNQ